MVEDTSVAAESGTQRGRVWLFQANPRRYNLAEEVQKFEPGAEDTWTVTRHRDDMEAGDRAVLWMGGPEAGVYALGTLLGSPEEQTGANPYSSGAGEGAWWRVRFRYDQILDPPLLKDEILEDPVLSELQVLRQPQGTNYPVRAEEWERLAEVVAKDESADELQALVDHLEATIPDEATRRYCLGWLVRAIREAHAFGPAGWAISLRHGQRVRLTLGRNLVFQIRDGRILVGLHEPSLGSDARQFVDGEAEKGKYEFKLSEGCFLYWFDATDFAKSGDLLREGFDGFMEASAKTASRSPVARAHRDTVLVALEQLTGENLPRPKYPSRRAEGGYWKIAPERGAVLWPGWLKGGYVSIGWDDLGNLSGLDRAGFEERLEAALARNKDWGRAGAEQVWRFMNIAPGGRVVANDGTRRVLGIGTVIGPYEYAEDESHPHRLPVRWDDLRERAVQRGGWRKTLIRLKKDDFEEILSAPSPTDDPPEPKRPEEEAEAEEKLDFGGLHSALGDQGLQFSEETLATYLLALQAKRFVLLSGISGTGKTRLAIEVAKALQADQPMDGTAAHPDDYQITVRPSHTKYKRFVLPSALLAKTPGLLEAALKRKKLTVVYPGGEQPVAIWKPDQANSLFLLLSGALGTWFAEQFETDDQFHVRIEPDENGIPTTVRLLLGDEAPANIERRFEIVAVRPDWTDNRGLLGFYNPLTKEYQPTPFLDLLLRAKNEHERARKAGRAARPYFAILDEMNLARVEHYFSDFLSCMESGDALHLHDDAALEEGETSDPIPMRLEIPRNLFFTGTVNIDETTYMFSPKVLDRAFTLEFNDVDLESFGDEADEDDSEAGASPLRLEQFDGALAIPALEAAKKSEKSKEWARFRSHEDGKLAAVVMGFNARLQPEHRHFGYRVANEIARFVNLAADQASKEPGTLMAALDVAVLSKVLPKMHGTQQELEQTLSRLFAFALDLDAKLDGAATDTGWQVEDGGLVPSLAEVERGEVALPRTAMKLWRMLRRLRQQGFASFIE